MDEVRVRPAEPRDDEAIAPLIYLPGRGMYDIYAGDARRAAALIVAALARPGNTLSRESVRVAELEDEPAGVLVTSPAAEGDARAAGFLRLALRRRPPWHWPRILWVERLAGQMFPKPAPDSLYVDTLATAKRFRRRGVATALLDAAAGEARARGLPLLMLDTTADNAAARALYEGYGFRATHHVPPRGPIPAEVVYVREVA